MAIPDYALRPRSTTDVVHIRRHREGATRARCPKDDWPSLLRFSRGGLYIGPIGKSEVQERPG